MPQLEYNIDFEMECPWLDKRLQSHSSSRTYVRSYAPFVHESCAVAMFFEYKSHFAHSCKPMLEIQSGLQDCQID